MSNCRLNAETPELIATFEAREAVMVALSEVQKLVKQQMGDGPWANEGEFCFFGQWHNVYMAIELASHLADGFARVCD